MVHPHNRAPRPVAPAPEAGTAGDALRRSPGHRAERRTNSARAQPESYRASALDRCPPRDRWRRIPSVFPWSQHRMPRARAPSEESPAQSSPAMPSSLAAMYRMADAPTPSVEQYESAARSSAGVERTIARRSQNLPGKLLSNVLRTRDVVLWLNRRTRAIIDPCRDMRLDLSRGVTNRSHRP